MHHSQQQVQQKFCRSNSATTFFRISSNSRIHRRHRPHAQQEILLHHWHPATNSFEFRGCNLDISKMQQQTWITTAQHNELQQRHGEEQSLSMTSSTTLSTASSTTRYGFNIAIYNIEMDKKSNNHLRKTQQRTTCPTIPLTSSDWGRGHQQQERSGERSDCQPSMGRIRQRLGEPPGCDATTWPQHDGGHHQQQWLTMGCLSPSEVRNTIDIMECNMVNSVETRFCNNVVIANMIMDIDIRNNLRLRMLLNKRDASVHGRLNNGHLTPQNDRGCFTQQFSTEFSEATNRRDHRHSLRHRHPREGQQHRVQQIFKNGFWMRSPTRNRDYWKNNFARNMVH